jgi:hypothetical protein
MRAANGGDSMADFSETSAYVYQTTLRLVSSLVRTPDRPASSLVTVTSTVSRFLA